MRKILLFVSLLAYMLTLSACGKINRGVIAKNSDTKKYRVTIVTNINFGVDTEIFLRADEVTVDREKMSVTIKGGLISDENIDHTFGVGLAHDTTFNFPSGGGEIEIWGPMGLYQRITEKTFFEEKTDNKAH